MYLWGRGDFSGLRVPYDGTIEVVKDLVPAIDPGLFELQVDGISRDVDQVTVGDQFDASDGDTTGPIKVSAGDSTYPVPIGDTHTVGEIAGTSTSLADYNSTISCIDLEGDTVGPTVGTGPVDVFVEPDDAWVCTITNTRKTGSLDVIKDVVPDDASLWTLSYNGLSSNGRSGRMANIWDRIQYT